MATHQRPAPGLGRRARRLSDHETDPRMPRAAVDMVSRAGLTVSLDHIRLGATVAAFLEPDPSVVWNDERLASVRRGLASLGDAGSRIQPGRDLGHRADG